MILCGVLARVDITTAKIRSCICMGSGLFLEGGCKLMHCPTIAVTKQQEHLLPVLQQLIA